MIMSCFVQSSESFKDYQKIQKHNKWIHFGSSGLHQGDFFRIVRRTFTMPSNTFLLILASCVAAVAGHGVALHTAKTEEDVLAASGHALGFIQNATAQCREELTVCASLDGWEAQSQCLLNHHDDLSWECQLQMLNVARHLPHAKLGMVSDVGFSRLEPVGQTKSPNLTNELNIQCQDHSTQLHRGTFYGKMPRPSILCQIFDLDGDRLFFSKRIQIGVSGCSIFLNFESSTLVFHFCEFYFVLRH